VDRRSLVIAAVFPLLSLVEFLVLPRFSHEVLALRGRREAMTRAARPLDLTVEEEGSDESRRRAGSRG